MENLNRDCTLVSKLHYLNFVNKIFLFIDNLVPRVLVILVHRWSGQQGVLGGNDPPLQDSWTSGSTAHVFDPVFQLTDAKIRGLPVLLRKSGGSLCVASPLDKGNEDSGNEIDYRR